MKRWSSAGGLFAASLLLGGCYESPDIEIYEPGVYKGREDPLLEKLKEPELQADLHQRLERGQTDR